MSIDNGNYTFVSPFPWSGKYTRFRRRFIWRRKKSLQVAIFFTRPRRKWRIYDDFIYILGKNQWFCCKKSKLLVALCAKCHFKHGRLSADNSFISGYFKNCDAWKMQASSPSYLTHYYINKEAALAPVLLFWIIFLICHQ